MLIVFKDLNFTGGVVHVVDRVLTLPVSVLETASAANLTSFRGAVNVTDLIDTVENTPDLTIFAPNNAAIRSVYGALEGLKEQDLQNILAYHVVNGSSPGYSSTLENGTTLQTAFGRNLTITIENGTYFVNAARVITPNILVANGVIHIIDKQVSLLPPPLPYKSASANKLQCSQP
jgi:uncharacterized surface protein with fasciclin (FAS1) repeats